MFAVVVTAAGQAALRCHSGRRWFLQPLMAAMPVRVEVVLGPRI